MKKALKKIVKKIWHYKDGKLMEGAPTNITGDLYGIRGDLTGISGDLDDCEITQEDRKIGIKIEDLVL